MNCKRFLAKTWWLYWKQDSLRELSLLILVLDQDICLHLFCWNTSVHYVGAQVYGVTCTHHLGQWTARLSLAKKEKIKCVTVWRISCIFFLWTSRNDKYLNIFFSLYLNIYTATLNFSKLLCAASVRYRLFVELAKIQIKEVSFRQHNFTVLRLVFNAHTFHVSISSECQEECTQKWAIVSLASNLKGFPPAKSFLGN